MPDPIGEARRRQRRRERLGVNAACIICGFSNLRALVPADIRVVEQDHPYGRQRDPSTTIALCQNHHRILTELRRDAAIPMKSGPDPLEELAMMHRSLGVAFEQLGKSQIEQAEFVLDLRERLLDQHPEVRETLEEFPSTYQMRGDNHE